MLKLGQFFLKLFYLTMTSLIDRKYNSANANFIFFLFKKRQSGVSQFIFLIVCERRNKYT